MELSNLRSVSWIYDLYRLGHTAFQANPTEIQQRILKHIVAGFSATSGCLALRDENSETLTITAGIDLPQRVIGSKVKFGEGVLGHVAKEGTPLLMNGDISNDPRFQTRKARTESKTPRSSMCWPLKIEDRIIGALSINKNTEIPFEQSHLQEGSVVINLVSVVIENARLHIKQQVLIRELKEAQAQLLQSEKMASIGQLAAGIAHEINNPVGYIHSNLGSFQKYLEDILMVIDAYEKAESQLPQTETIANILALKKKLDLDFLKQDAVNLLNESREGVNRVRKIVQDLKEFSHVNASEWQSSDLHKGLDSTLNIAHNEIKYKAEVIKEYGDMPLVECLPSQINQVLMNLLVNAAQSIEERGRITLRTGHKNGEAWIEVSDTGKGIAKEHINRIFDPFFTTKPVGKGTGLGLSLSYGIIKKHKGRIEVESTPGKGSKFRIWLPIKHSADLEETSKNAKQA